MTSLSNKKIISTKVECLICTDDISSRKIIKCPYCQFEACCDCIETFLMGIDDDRPRCMNNSCKKVWSYDFLAENFSSSFHNQKYRERRATLYYEREKSLLPATLPLVQAEIKREKINKKISDIEDENRVFMELIRNNKERIRKLRWETDIPLVNKPVEKKSFTRGCPVDDCRGFLSTNLKCGLCSTYACKDCHLPKKSRDDDEHKCDPDLVATVKLLANDTKPCPSCATPIYKIDGCDQMFCTTCHTAFSWVRGTIERGIIHNPHYFEMQRKLNNGVIPRNPLDNPCGRDVPDFSKLDKKLSDSGIYMDSTADMIRLIAHINAVEIPQYPYDNNRVTDCSKMRIQYLMNKIDEKQWLSKLKKNMKQNEKNEEISMILRMFTATLRDLLNNIMACKPTDVHIYVNSIYDLREYTNRSLKKVGNNYGNVYPCISNTFGFKKNAVVAKKKVAKKKVAKLG